MQTFSDYAQYYDALYSDKDYEAECDYIEEIFNLFSSNKIRHILDLGCGTGGHVFPLIQRGYKVSGVDSSERMLAAARKKAEENNVQVEFVLGDIRSLELDQQYDAIIAMFAVMSYQTTNDDLLATFKTAHQHLHKDGLLIFDSWYGPAVLTIRPSPRTKTIELGKERIVRTAEPVLDSKSNLVKVNYTVTKSRGDQSLEETSEPHIVRYLFAPEVEMLCDLSGFELIQHSPFMVLDRPPSETDWNVSWVARAL